jgi:hypothetical protein
MNECILSGGRTVDPAGRFGLSAGRLDCHGGGRGDQRRLQGSDLIPRVGEYAGHVLSTALLVAALLVTSFVYFQWTPIEYAYVELVVIGVGWTGLTIGFEFLVGYVEGTPVSVTLGQYNVLAGQVWIVVPLTLLLSPLLFGWYLS